LVAPTPPIPIPAIFSLSLGARYPRPLTTLLGRIVRPAIAAPVVPTNDRLVIFFVSLFIFQVVKSSIQTLKVNNSSGKQNGELIIKSGKLCPKMHKLQKKNRDDRDQI
jgi:hypothetical protein